jgi:hypothetical protein
MKWILFIVLIISLIPSLASAEVSLILDGYNSQDSMAMSLVGQNLDFGGLLYLEPQTLIFKSGGASNDPDGFYDFNIRFNDDEIPISADAVSGGFAWMAEIKTPLVPYSAYPDELFAVNAKHLVYNYGTLKSAYGNNNIKADEYVRTLGAAYEEAIGITPDGLQSKGAGTVYGDVTPPKEPVSESPQPDLSDGFVSMSNGYVNVQRGPATQTDNSYEKPDHSKTDSPTDNSAGEGETQDGRGFEHRIRVDGLNDWGWIRTDIESEGDVSATWNCGVNSEGSDIAFGVGVDGMSEDAMKVLLMEAEGSDIPYQSDSAHVKIDFSTESELELEEYYQYASAQKEDFYEDYPSDETSDEPWTWYYVNQNVFVVSSEEENSPETEEGETATPELFQMMMGFYIRDNK